MNKLLKILENNARLTNKEIAVMLDKSEKEVEKDITLLEDTGILKGYKAIIDKDKAEVETVTALIEIKVQPKYGHGFNDVANRISQLEEVESIYLLLLWLTINHFRRLLCLLQTVFLRLRVLFQLQRTLF